MFKFVGGHTGAYLVLLSTLLPAEIGMATSVGDQWTEFLAHPDGNAFQDLVDQITRCRGPSCDTNLAPDSEANERLAALVSEGNERAVTLAFLILRFLDGGNLEDMYRSLGDVADSKPRFFLAQANKDRVSPKELEDIVNMLPEYVIDHVAKRRRALERRIRSLSSVTDPSFIEARDRAIASLERSLARASRKE